MPTDQSRAYYQALLVPDHNVSVWEAETSATPKGPHPGQPELQGTTEELESPLELRSERSELSGALTGTSLDLTVTRGGLPRPCPSTFPAGFRWKTNSGSDIYGWDPPSRTRRAHILPATGGNLFYRPSVCKLASGRALLVFENPMVTGLSVYYADPGDSGWTSLATVSPEGYHSGTGVLRARLWPTLLATDDRLWIYYWKIDKDNKLMTIGAIESTDSGSTWTERPSPINETIQLDETLNSHVGADGVYAYGNKIGAAFRNGEIVLLAGLDRCNGSAEVCSTFRQYASSDGGYSFSALGEWENTDENGGRWATIQADTDGFHLIYLGVDETNTYGMPTHRTIASAYELFEQAEGALVGQLIYTRWSTSSTSGSSHQSKVDAGLCSFTIAEDGAYYLHGCKLTGTTQGRTLVSYDRGGTWNRLEPEPVPGSGTSGDQEGWWNGSELTEAPLDMVSISMGGQIWIVSSLTSSTTEGIITLALGGYTDKEAPIVGLGGFEQARACWTQVYVPIALPNTFSSSIARTATAALSESLGSGYLVLTGAASTNQYSYEDSFGAISPVVGMEGVFVVKVDDPVAKSSPQLMTASVDVVLGDATEAYGIRVGVTDTTVYAWEKTGAGTSSSDYSLLGSLTVDTGKAVAIRLAIGKDGTSERARIWAREETIGALDPEVAYTLIGTSDALTDISAHFSTGRVQLTGRISNSGSSDQATWYYAAWDQPSGSPVGRERIANYIAATSSTMVGRPFSTRGAYVSQGVTVVASGGIARPAQEYRISADYDHPVSATLEPSPRQTFREASTASGVLTLAYQWAEEDRYIGSDILGIGLFRSTFNAVAVALYDEDSSSWTAEQTIVLQEASLDWARSGTSILPGGTEALFVRDSEYDGGYFCPGTTIAGSTIQQTIGGVWNTSSRIPALLLDPEQVKGTWNASGSAGLIVPPAAVILIPLAGVRYRGVRIRALGSSRTITPEGVHELGRVLIGPVFLHPDSQSWGRSITVDALVDSQELDDGATQVETIGSDVRRAFEVSWVDGIDTLGSSTDSADPGIHYLDEAKTEPDGLTGTTAWQLQGLHRRLRGSSEQVVYLPRVETIETSEGHRILNRRSELALCRMGDDLRLDTVQGDENYSEVIRLSTTLREEV